MTEHLSLSEFLVPHNTPRARRRLGTRPSLTQRFARRGSSRRTAAVWSRIRKLSPWTKSWHLGEVTTEISEKKPGWSRLKGYGTIFFQGAGSSCAPVASKKQS